MFRRLLPRNLVDQPGDCTSEMDRVDDRLEERLLRGTLAAHDAPRGYGGVAMLLHDARTEARALTSVRTEETIAAMVAAIQGSQATRPLPQRGRRRQRSRVAAGAAAGFLTLFGSLTGAGALPSAAQNGMSTVLAKVGIEVPRGHGSDEKPSTSEDEGNPVAGVSEGPNTTNHGQCVSEVAGSGGEAVSEAARSDCGKDPKAPGGNGNGNGPPEGEPPGQSENKENTPPTHPPQSSSGGSGGPSNADANANANATGQGGSDKPDK